MSKTPNRFAQGRRSTDADDLRPRRFQRRDLPLELHDTPRQRRHRVEQGGAAQPTTAPVPRWYVLVRIRHDRSAFAGCLLTFAGLRHDIEHQFT
jgi:hypothetical protein